MGGPVSRDSGVMTGLRGLRDFPPWRLLGGTICWWTITTGKRIAEPGTYPVMTLRTTLPSV